ncbi:Metallo-dependent phosphatase-like protein [Hypoxylon cercidicola]|nr:Metallo-dependent phosphatase-like protein [Hypoxylon cercidicola]
MINVCAKAHLDGTLYSRSSVSTMGCDNGHTVVTDLTISFCSPTDPPSICGLDPQKWHRIEKELYLHTARQTAWLHVAQAKEEDLTADDLVVTDIKISDLHPDPDSDNSWESRLAGIWVLRSNYSGDHEAITAVDVLFGVDAVEPRPQWALIRPPLQLKAKPEVPVAQLSVRQGTAKPKPDTPRAELRIKEDGKFKVLQISDTHMVTGVGVCNDAMDAHRQPLPESEADPLTVNFLSKILDIEKPDFVILTGDQLHHDILDSQSTLFKVVAPLIQRSVPYAAVFGNHDDEGTYALSRTAQMSLLQDLPFSLSQPGPEQVDGVGNYYLQVFAQAPSQLPLLTFYFLDSHGEIPSKVKNPDYGWITQSQIDWFTCTSQMLRKAHKNDNEHDPLSLVFMHIPFPEYADSGLVLRGGHRGEPTEGPSFNSHFYDALVKEGVAAVGCGHDHVNDFCALRPQKDGSKTPEPGPWLCYGGGSGFGGYGSYGGRRYYRRTRVWEFDTNNSDMKTWKRVEYAEERVDELVLVDGGAVATAPDDIGGGASGKSTSQDAL